MIPSGFAIPAGHCPRCNLSYPAGEGRCSCRDTAPIGERDIKPICDAVEAVLEGNDIPWAVVAGLRGILAHDRVPLSQIPEMVEQAMRGVAEALSATLADKIEVAVIADRERRRREPEEPT